MCEELEFHTCDGHTRLPQFAYSDMFSGEQDEVPTIEEKSAAEERTYCCGGGLSRSYMKQRLGNNQANMTEGYSKSRTQTPTLRITKSLAVYMLALGYVSF